MRLLHLRQVGHGPQRTMLQLHFDDGTVIIPADHFLAHGLLPTVARVLAIPSTTQIILPPRKYPG
jgi:hypothetical protein